MRQRVRIYWYAYKTELEQAAKWTVLAVLGLVIAASVVIVYINRPNEIAPPLRSFIDTDDAVVMEVIRICNGAIVAKVSNNTDYSLLFGAASIKAEQYSAGSWRILPFRRNAVFRLYLRTVQPRQSTYVGLSLSQVSHTFRNGELYRLRLEVYVDDSSFMRIRPSHAHDIVAEFFHGELPACESICD